MVPQNFISSLKSLGTKLLLFIREDDGDNDVFTIVIVSKQEVKHNCVSLIATYSYCSSSVVLIKKMFFCRNRSAG